MRSLRCCLFDSRSHAVTLSHRTDHCLLLAYVLSQFEIIGNAVWATATASIDFETGAQVFILNVIAYDVAAPQFTDSLTIQFTVSNQNDFANVTSAAVLTIPENLPNNSLVYTLTWTDQDALDKHWMAMQDTVGASSNGNNGKPAFAFNVTSGELRIASLLNYELGPQTYFLNFTILDDGATTSMPPVTTVFILTVNIQGAGSLRWT